MRSPPSERGSPLLAQANDVAALRAQVTELANQLKVVRSERDRLLASTSTASPPLSDTPAPNESLGSMLSHRLKGLLTGDPSFSTTDTPPPAVLGTVVEGAEDDVVKV